ncbi:zeta toxin family protein [Candidatus Poriferisodalis sp.]|uniref:zeta toxin family protein n=1 Tax=Candidatus Poriferisodalis sp. TaxID=3101277 RepID=UPI003B518EA5
MKEILIIAGPNGDGKTTFAFRYLRLEQRGIPFVNADLIGSGLDPTEPGHADIQAGRLMLAELDRHADEGRSFAFETTLSGRGYLRKIRRWRADGYGVSLIFLSLPSAEDAVRRVAQRVSRGGHHVPPDVVRRRFAAGLRNLRELYSHEVDSWVLYDNIEEPAIELERSPDHD